MSLEHKISLLKGRLCMNNIQFADLLKQIHNEEWNNVFNHCTIKALVDVIINEENKDTDLVQILLTYVNENVKETVESHTCIVAFGIAALKLFIQVNWTGPQININEVGLLEPLVSSQNFNTRALNLLESNGEELYQLVSYPILLLIAKVILIEMLNTLNLYSTLFLWTVKCTSVYLSVLEETRDEHFEIFKKVVEKVESEETKLKELPIELQAEFYLDCSHLYLKFYDYQKSKACHDIVKKLLHLEISLTASLGKRTKFQQNNLPQMKLDITTDPSRNFTQSKGEVTKDLPTDVTLDDDTLLPHIKFVDVSNVKNVDLSPIDQAYALTCCLYLQKTRPRDKLTHEEVLPFVDSVLMAPQSWSIQFKSLYLRCMTEFSNSRKAERALTQLEALTNSVNKPTPKASERFLFIQSVDLQPKWQTERSYAQLLFTVGLTDSALEIFLRLQLWDDVIACYQRLGKHGKAEAVIREQLSKHESATLWCLLGDATMDKQYYEKAWEFSNHRNARSQRSIGLYHLRKQEFAECIPYFQKSLELNVLQPGIAFSLGCACMAENQIGTAAKSFQQCVALDPDNHEAWNNLASNFIKLGKIKKAYKALQESTRLSYDNWKIWENYLLVCTDLGAFEESIHCCHRLVDLRRKELDDEVLHILVKSVLSGEEDFNGISASRLKPKLFKMFGHVTSQITHNPSIWELYAELYLHENTAADKEKALQYLYKSHRCFTQNTEWEKSEKKLPSVMRVTTKVMQVTRDVCNCEEFAARTISLYSTTKMAVSNLIIRLKKTYCDDLNNPLDSVQPSIKELDDHLTELTAFIENAS